jgi:nitrate reductase gamma subunit
MKGGFLFAVWPYLAVGFLVIGTGGRYLLARRSSSALANEVSDAWATFGRGWLWQAGLLLLVAGHFAGLVFPRSILLWNASATRLYLLEGLAFAAGLLALAGWCMLAWRQLKDDSGSWLTQLADSAFLALLFVGLLSGTLIAVFYRWGSSWGVMALTPYVRSLLNGQPAVNAAVQMHFLIRLHVVSAFAALAVIPATRLSAILVAGLNYSFNLMGRPLSFAKRGAEAWLSKHNPATWLWPEED